ARVYAPRDVLSDDVVDERIGGGETIAIGDSTIEVISTPGHTLEHVCFLTADGDLFTGDTILGVGTSAIFPPDGHMGDYMRTLGRLLALRPKRIFPAHGPVRDDAVELIREYLGHRFERERQVLAAVAAGASTIPELRDRIYPELDPSLHDAAGVQLWAHLIKLVEDGRVVEEGAEYRTGK
ncbi:MAG: MBL fold metallo-hydrolase, partial [Thermoanaerobaculia bacterium]